MRIYSVLLLWVLTYALNWNVAAGEDLQLVDGDVVVFMGGANMVRGARAGLLETYLTDAFVDEQAEVRFRDLSWEADTVYRLGTVRERWRSDGFGNRVEQFRRVGMTVAIMQFGKMEAMQGVESLDAFEEHYRGLLKDVAKQARHIILLTPLAFERPENSLIPDVSKHNASLQEYVRVIVALAKEFDATLIDLFSTS